MRYVERLQSIESNESNRPFLEKRMSSFTIALLLLIGVVTATYPYSWQDATITVPSPQADAHFGFSLALSSAVTAIGAPEYDTTASNAGSVWLLYDSTSKQLSSSVAGAGLGTSLAVDEDTVVAGAPGEEAAHVYTHSGALWPTVALHRSVGRFGAAVAISGGYIAVGAPEDSSNAEKAGSVTVYHLDSGVWTVQQTITASAVAGDRFGTSVALSDDTLIVGAEERAGVGAAYVFTVSGTTWTLQQTLTKSLAAGAKFGHSVALEGDVAVIGAPYTDSVDNTGSVTIWRRAAGIWSATDLTITAPHSSFGVSVAIASGVVAVISALQEGAVVTSTAHVFSSAGTLVHSEPLMVNGGFASVAMAHGVAVTGSPAAPQGGLDAAGAAVTLTADCNAGYGTDNLLTCSACDGGQFKASAGLSACALCSPFSTSTPSDGQPHIECDAWITKTIEHGPVTFDTTKLASPVVSASVALPAVSPAHVVDSWVVPVLASVDDSFTINVRLDNGASGNIEIASLAPVEFTPKVYMDGPAAHWVTHGSVCPPTLDVVPGVPAALATVTGAIVPVCTSSPVTLTKSGVTTLGPVLFAEEGACGAEVRACFAFTQARMASTAGVTITAPGGQNLPTAVVGGSVCANISLAQGEVYSASFAGWELPYSVLELTCTNEFNVVPILIGLLVVGLVIVSLVIIGVVVVIVGVIAVILVLRARSRAANGDSPQFVNFHWL